MYIQVTKSIFMEEFIRRGRGEQFSYEALEALFDYYEELECGEDFERVKLDIIAICCEWTEYTESELFEAYTIIDLDELRDNTTVIELSGTYLIREY